MRYRRFIAATAIALGLSACSAPELHTVRWQRADLTRDGLVTAYPADRCETLDHVEIEYNSADLTMTVFLRNVDRPCLGVRLLRRVLVPLHEPLSGRTIVDGAG